MPVLLVLIILLAPVAQETVMPETHDLTILVRDGQGKPLRDVHLRLLRDWGGTVQPADDAAGQLGRAQTDATGRYTFRVPWGSYVLQFHGAINGHTLQPIVQQGVGGAEEACSSQPGFCIRFAERDQMTVRLAIGGLAQGAPGDGPALPLWDDAASDTDPVQAISAQTGQAVDPEQAAARLTLATVGPAPAAALMASARAAAGQHDVPPLTITPEAQRITGRNAWLLLILVLLPTGWLVWWRRREAA